MDKSYFVNGLNHIKQFVKNPLILIFSDDNEWASKNLDFIKDEKIIIEDEWKGDKYQYSMYLMSRCKNFIISNSSFGWWGAWLSDYINKKVVAPKSWYKLPFYHTKVKLPSDWHQI